MPAEDWTDGPSTARGEEDSCNDISSASSSSSSSSSSCCSDAIPKEIASEYSYDKHTHVNFNNKHQECEYVFLGDSDNDVGLSEDLYKDSSASKATNVGTNLLEMTNNIEILDNYSLKQLIDDMVDRIIHISTFSKQEAFELLKNNGWNIEEVILMLHQNIMMDKLKSLQILTPNLLDNIQECSICGNHLSQKEFLSLSSCRDAFCKNCWFDYLNYNMSTFNRLFTIKCPCFGCEKYVDYQLWNEVLNNFDTSPLNTHYENDFASFIVTLPNQKIFKRCLNNCSFIIYCKNIMGSSTNMNVICKCGCQFCFRCSNINIGNHFPFSCNQIQSMTFYGSYLHLNPTLSKHSPQYHDLSLFRCITMIETYGTKNTFADYPLFNILKYDEVYTADIIFKNCPSCLRMVGRPNGSAGNHSTSIITCGHRDTPEIIGCGKRFCWYCEQLLGEYEQHSQCRWENVLFESPSTLYVKDFNTLSKKSIYFLLNTFKTCPKCNVVIEKITGCSSVVCTQCKTFFCWECKNPSSHEKCLPKLDSGNPKILEIFAQDTYNSQLFMNITSFKKQVKLIYEILQDLSCPFEITILNNWTHHIIMSMNFSFWLRIYLYTLIQTDTDVLLCRMNLDSLDENLKLVYKIVDYNLITMHDQRNRNEALEREYVFVNSLNRKMSDQVHVLKSLLSKTLESFLTLKR